MKVIPVIHHIDTQTTIKNAAMCARLGAWGVALISMDTDNEELCAIGEVIKWGYPNIKVGVNHLGESALESIAKNLESELDFTWTDNQLVKDGFVSELAHQCSDALKNKNHLLFSAVSFKYQAKDSDPVQSTLKTYELGFIPTTSGAKTGASADLEYLKNLSSIIPQKTLAVASGLTPENVLVQKHYLGYGLVATGVSKDFHSFDEDLLKKFILNSN